MIDWSKISPKLVELITSLSLDDPPPEFKAQWAHKTRDYLTPSVAAELVLRVVSVQGVGSDETRHKEVTITPDVGDPYIELHEQIVGHRKFVLEVRVESQIHSEEENRWCWSICERIRTRLRRGRSNAALRAINVSLLSIGAATDTSFSFEKRKINVALMPITFYAAFCDTDTVSVNWFERVLLTSQIKNVDNTLLSSPPNFTDLPIPDDE